MPYNCMSDGRCLTDWRNSCDRDLLIKARANIRNNNDYRRFLQANALQLQAQQRQTNFCFTPSPDGKDSSNCQSCCSCMQQNPYKVMYSGC